MRADKRQGGMSGKCQAGRRGVSYTSGQIALGYMEREYRPGGEQFAEGSASDQAFTVDNPVDLVGNIRASAGIYFSRGDVPPLVAAPVALGVLLGAFLGTRLMTRLMTRLSNKALRLIFLPVMAVIALE